MANRIKPFLDGLIPPSQTGFIEGRFIGEATRLIYDVIHITNEKKLTGILMLIDFEKAFDSISWQFLYKTLHKFNFSNGFINWIRTLNNNIWGAVMQCGTLSEFFKIERGCKQGDLISPYLFILCAHILTTLIESNHDIKGIEIDGLTIKLTQFADDTTLLLDGTKDSLQAALNMLEVFGDISGLKMNKDKTKIVWLGRQKHSKDKFVTQPELIWGATEFMLLGLNFSVDIDKIEDLNFGILLDKLSNDSSHQINHFCCLN